MLPEELPPPPEEGVATALTCISTLKVSLETAFEASNKTVKVPTTLKVFAVGFSSAESVSLFAVPSKSESTSVSKSHLKEVAFVEVLAKVT